MTLNRARKQRVYTIQKIEIDDGKTQSFLFSLGLFGGEKICVLSRVRGGLLVRVGGGKYCIDTRLASGIII